jgi:hypothetical protein
VILSVLVQSQLSLSSTPERWDWTGTENLNEERERMNETKEMNDDE